jgi:hypothetical protein
MGFDARPIALAQVAAPGYADTAVTSATIDVTVAQLVIAAVYFNQEPDTITVTDSIGLSWASLPPVDVLAGCGGNTGNATAAQLWYAQGTSAGVDTVTVTQTSGTQPLGVFVLAYEGIASMDPVETTSVQIAPIASSTASMPPLVTQHDTVIVALFNDTLSTGTWTGGDGFTIEAHDDGFPNMLEDAIVPPGMWAPKGTLPPGHNDSCWVGTALALRGG